MSKYSYTESGLFQITWIKGATHNCLAKNNLIEFTKITPSIGYTTRENYTKINKFEWGLEIKVPVGQARIPFY